MRIAMMRSVVSLGAVAVLAVTLSGCPQSGSPLMTDQVYGGVPPVAASVEV